MATIGLGANAATAAAGFTTTPDKYTTIDELLAYNKPDNRELLIKTYGDQGITGFLKLTGAIKNGGQADLIQYWEEQRRHRKVLPGTSTGGSGVETLGTPIVNTSADFLELNTVVMNADDGLVYIVTGLDGSGSTQVLTRLDGVLTSANFTATTELIILGNMYDQGSDQPSTFMKTEPTKRLNSYMIIKDRYEVNGSQATNIGWVNVGGDYRWYVHGEQETRRRFEDRREMMMLFAERTAAAGAAVPSYGGGSEGYFSAVNDRGIIVSNASANPLDSFAEFDSIILELDKQGAPSEYAMYVDNKTSLIIDDMLATGLATSSMTAGLPGQFGAFNNDRDMAVQLGFKSFTRGGYTFHKHDWKLLNDPQLLGAFTTKPYRGAMVPMTQVADAKTGVKAPALEMNYKETNGYSRELEHWVEGGGVLGFKTNDEDVAKFHYRSECNLITRAANKHVVLN